MRLVVHVDARLGASGMLSFVNGLLYGYRRDGQQHGLVTSHGLQLARDVLRLGPEATYHATANFDFLPNARANQIITMHDVFLAAPEGGARLITRAKCRALLNRIPKTAIVVCISNATRAQLPEGAQRQARVLFQGVSPQLAECIADPTIDRNSERRPYFLYTGGAHRRKRVGLLLAAFHEYQRRGGSSILLSTSDLGLRVPAGVVVRPAQAPAQLAALYKGAVACLYPSASEGYGLPLLEASMAGVPSVSGPVPAALEDEATWATNQVMSLTASVGEWASALSSLEDDRRRQHPAFGLEENDARWIAHSQLARAFSS